MIIYTYQPQELIDKVNKRGFIYVDFAKTNLYRQSQLPGRNMEAYHEAYMWMARKLAEKTGIWMKTVYGSNLDIQKDADGDYIDEEGQKLPIFPFWGWYITDGKRKTQMKATASIEEQMTVMKWTGTSTGVRRGWSHWRYQIDLFFFLTQTHGIVP